MWKNAYFFAFNQLIIFMKPTINNINLIFFLICRQFDLKVQKELLFYTWTSNVMISII